MEIILIVLILVLLFLNKEIFNNHPSKKCTEPMSVEMPDDQEPSFNPNSRSNDYYYDRTGMKGSLFNILGKSKYMLPKVTPRKLDYNKTIHDLELYPEQFYSECKSEFDQSKLTHPTINNDPLNTYLDFNQGVLVRNKCGMTKKPKCKICNDY